MHATLWRAPEAPQPPRIVHLDPDPQTMPLTWRHAAGLLAATLIPLTLMNPARADDSRHWVEAWADAAGRRIDDRPALQDALRICRIDSLRARAKTLQEAAFARHFRAGGAVLLRSGQDPMKAIDEANDAREEAADEARAHPDYRRAQALAHVLRAHGAACVSRTLGETVRVVWWHTRQQKVMVTRHPAVYARDGRWEGPMQTQFRQIAAFAGPPTWQARAWDRFVATWTDWLPDDAPDRTLIEEAAVRRAALPATAPSAAAAVPAGPSASAAVSRAVETPCALCPPVVTVPAGVFMMGSPGDEPDRFHNEALPHPVAIDGFRLTVTEVTLAQWVAVLGQPPKRAESCGDDCPVHQVTWHDVQAFIRALNARTGQAYRLPSEAEWEYAARAGTETAYAFGPEVSRHQANVTPSHWGGRVKVGSYAPNAWGLQDMHGNVWEWVQDCLVPAAEGRADGVAVESDACAHRGLRGGDYQDGAAEARSARRAGAVPGGRNGRIGFRLALPAR